MSPHISYMTYFYEWGVLQSRTDPNGLAEHFEYDDHGRKVSRFTPYDAAIPAVSYEYSRGPNSRMTARTATKVTLDPADPSIIETLILIDGLGRPIYTAKSGCIANPGYTGSDYGSTASGTLGWNLSGAIRCDAKGRTIAQGQPIFAPGKANPPFPPMINPTLTTYDGLGRLLRTRYPDMDDVTYTYGDPDNAEHKTIHDIGRILSRTDQSGSIDYRFGKMGEVVQEERTLNSQRYGNSLSAVTGFQSDYLGRIN